MAFNFEQLKVYQDSIIWVKEEQLPPLVDAVIKPTISSINGVARAI